MHGEFLRIISRMWKCEFEKIMLFDDYTAQNTWRIVESIEAKSRWQGCNAAIVRPSVSPPLFVWLNVSLSPFSASFSVVLLHVSFLVLFFSSTIFNLLHRSLPVSLSRSAHVSFLVLSTLSSFSAKFKLQFSLHVLLFSFREIHEIFVVLLLLDGQVQLVLRISLHILYIKPCLFKLITLNFNSDKTKWELYNEMFTVSEIQFFTWIVKSVSACYLWIRILISQSLIHKVLFVQESSKFCQAFGKA